MNERKMSGNLPLDVVPFTEEEGDAIDKIFTGDSYRYNIHVGPSGYVLKAKYAQLAANFYNMALRTDDTVISTFPRSGTTWTQELVWLISNELNYDKAKAVSMSERYSGGLMEMCMFMHNDKVEQLKQRNADNAVIVDKIAKPGYEILENTTSPRFIKTHLPLSLLPPTLLDVCKTVYVARDPRDVAVSNYYLYKDNFHVIGATTDFKDFYDLFEKDLLLWCPYFAHVKEAWAQRHHPNMLFIFYEDMIKDLKGTARRVADFFGKSYSDEQLDHLCDHLQFDNFKKNASVGLTDIRQVGDLQMKNFIRKGKSGGWREYFDEEMTARVQKWIDEELRDTDLRFPQ